MASCMMLMSTVMAHTAMSLPYFSREELKHTEIRLSVDCMMKGARPRARQGRNTDGTGFRFSRRSRHFVRGPVRNRSTHTADTAWERMVARAAPRTPSPRTKMKMGSRRVFRIAPISTVFMLTVVKPWAVI